MRAIALVVLALASSCAGPGDIMAAIEPERPPESQVAAADIGPEPKPEQALELAKSFVVWHLKPSSVSEEDFRAKLKVKCGRIDRVSYPLEMRGLWKIGYVMPAESTSPTDDGSTHRKWRLFFRDGKLVAWERAEFGLNINGTRDIQELDAPITLSSEISPPPTAPRSAPHP